MGFCAAAGREWIFLHPSGKYIVYFYPIGQKKVTLGPLFRSKNDENRACVTKTNLSNFEIRNNKNSGILKDKLTFLIILCHVYTLCVI